MGLFDLERQPIDARERLNREIVQPFYTDVEDYDWTAVTDRLRGPESIMHRFRERMIRRLISRYAQNGPVLDVGCGSGLMLRHLPPSSVGMDLNPRNIKRAKQYAPNARVVFGDAERLQFGGETFAAVLMTEVLEHLVFPERSVQEIFRVLRPGGVFFGSVPRASWLWHLRGLSATCPAEEPFHHEMRRVELRWLLTQAPFVGVRVERAWWLMQYFFVAQKKEGRVR